jgi:hypothetical protein
MPLSEHEERILAEIERKLAEDDPRFVARAQARARRGWSRTFRLRLAAVLAVLGVVSVLSLTFSIVFGALGMAMLLAALVLTVQTVKQSEQRARSVVPPDERS